MNSFNDNITKYTPTVSYGEDGKLLLKGRCMPEDVAAFFKPLIDWAYALKIESLTVDIDLDYLNSTSSRKLLDLLKILDANNNIKEFIINWHFETGDEDAVELGQIYEELLLKASFRYREYHEVA